MLEGERKYEKEEKGEGYFHTERSYGRFYRSIPVPEGTNIDKATAQFNNGVLNVVIPIPENLPKMREIPRRQMPGLISSLGFAGGREMRVPRS